MVDSSAGPHEAAGRGDGELRVEPQRHQVAQGLRQFARQIVAERALFGEPGDARRGAGLGQAALERQRAHAVDDRENAALLEIERVALVLVR